MASLPKQCGELDKTAGCFAQKTVLFWQHGLGGLRQWLRRPFDRIVEAVGKKNTAFCLFLKKYVTLSRLTKY